MFLPLAGGEVDRDLGKLGDQDLDARRFCLPGHFIEVLVAKLGLCHLGDCRTGCCSQHFVNGNIN